LKKCVCSLTPTPTLLGTRLHVRNTNTDWNQCSMSSMMIQSDTHVMYVHVDNVHMDSEIPLQSCCCKHSCAHNWSIYPVRCSEHKMLGGTTEIMDPPITNSFVQIRLNGRSFLPERRTLGAQTLLASANTKREMTYHQVRFVSFAHQRDPHVLVLRLRTLMKARPVHIANQDEVRRQVCLALTRANATRRVRLDLTHIQRDTPSIYLSPQ
jgi:hypothetical protein